MQDKSRRSPESTPDAAEADRGQSTGDLRDRKMRQRLRDRKLDGELSPDQMEKAGKAKAQVTSCINGFIETSLMSVILTQTALQNRAKEAAKEKLSENADFAGELNDHCLDKLKDMVKDFAVEGADIGKSVASHASTVFGLFKGKVDAQISAQKTITAVDAINLVSRNVTQAVQRFRADALGSIGRVPMHEYYRVSLAYSGAEKALTEQTDDPEAAEVADVAVDVALGLPVYGPDIAERLAQENLEKYNNLVQNSKTMGERGNEVSDRRKAKGAAIGEVREAEETLGIKEEDIDHSRSVHERAGVK